MAQIPSNDIVLNISSTKKVFNPLIRRKESLWEKIQRIGTVSQKEILLFFELLSTLNNAGLPINESLEILAKQIKNPRLRFTVSEIRHHIKEGLSFSNALRRYPELFDEATCAVIQAGEKSGKLNDILKELIHQMQRTQDLKNQVKSVLTYPAIVISVMVILTGVLLIAVIPKLESIFQGVGNLPLPTRILVNLSDTIIYQWPSLLIGVLGFGLVAYFLYQTSFGKRFCDWFLISSPIIGPLMRKMTLERTNRLLGLLLTSGVPIVESLKLSSDISGNIIYKEKLLLASEDVTRGISLGETLADNHKLFPDVMIQMLSIGEKTASLDVVVTRVANFYDEELGREIASLSKILEPFILAIIASGAVFMILAIYLPILQMNDHLM